MAILSSVRFLLPTLVVTSAFVHIFTDAQLEKWALDVPVGTYNKQTKTFTLTFDVDDSITQANIAATVWDPVGQEGGNQLLDAEGIEGITTSVVTTGEATLTFDLNFQILRQNINVFTDLPAQNEAEMKVCARFMLYTDDGSIEVNFIESIVTLTIDLVSDVATSIEVEKKAFTDKGFDKGYSVNAYLCDPNNPSEELTGLAFRQGSTIRVCVTPSQEALDDSIRMKSIDSFSWVKGELASQSAIDSNGPANILTTTNCMPESIYCDINTLLKADFYRTTDAPTSSPTWSPTSSPIFSAPSPDSGGGYGGGQNDSICNGGYMNSEMTVDFSNSTVLENDLFDGELRYGNVGYIPGTGVVDLVITSMDYLNQNANASGLDDSENFGKIGLVTEPGNPDAGKGTFSFCFVQPNTYSLVTVDQFQWSVFDLDTRSGSPAIAEKIAINLDQVSGYSIYPDSNQTELNFYCENDNSMPPCAFGVRTVFEGTTVGNGNDNPTDPDDLTVQQMKRSVVFEFQNTACWTVEFNAYCPAWPGYCSSYGGAKFFFSGGSSQIVQNGANYCLDSGGYRRRLSSEYSKDHPVESEGSMNSSKNGSAGSDNGSSDLSSNDVSVEKRNLQETDDVVVGFGSCTLMLSRRRRLDMDERALQADPTAPVELNVDLVTIDDGYSLRQTAGGLSRRFEFFFIFGILANAAILLL